MWSEVQEADLSASWAELSENGWGALMGRASGQDSLRRRPTSDAGRTVTGTPSKQASGNHGQRGQGPGNAEALAVQSTIEWAHGGAFDICQFPRNGEGSTQLL